MFTHFTHKGRQAPHFVVYYGFNEDMTVKEKKKNETKKMIGEIAILLILMGLTFSVLLRDQDLGEVVESVFSVRKRWLIPAVLCMGVYIFCGGLCIRVMQHGLGHKMSIARCFKYSFVEFYFSAITPSSTGGQPMQLVYMKKDGYNVSESSVILVAITAMYKLSFVLLCLVMFALNYNYISGQIDAVHVMFVLGLILDVGMVLLLGLLLFSHRAIRFLARGGVHLLVKLHLVKAPEKKLASVDRIIKQYRECSEFVRTHPVIILRTFAVLTIQRIAIIAVPYFVYRSFGFHGYSFIQIFTTQLLLTLSVEMLPLPGSVGASESAFLILFGPIFTEDQIYSAILLSRGISFYLMLLLAGLYIIGLHFFYTFLDKRKK